MEDTNLLTLVMMKASRVFTSVTRFEVMAPEPSVSYSFIDAIRRCSMRRLRIIKVTCLDIFVKILVMITPRK